MCSPWPTAMGRRGDPNRPARGSGQGPSARPAACCATAPTCTSMSTWPTPLGDAGDLPLPNTHLPQPGRAIEAAAEPLVRQHHMAWLRGDHHHAEPARHTAGCWGRPLAVLRFDPTATPGPITSANPAAMAPGWPKRWPKGSWYQVHDADRHPFSCGAWARDHVNDRGGQIVTARDLRGVESPVALASVPSPSRPPGAMRPPGCT